MNPDVLVIGGGVIGLSIARELRTKGVKRVMVVDKGSAGGEASWAAAGMLAPQVEADKADDFFTFCAAIA
jgi:glycine oxidase